VQSQSLKNNSFSKEIFKKNTEHFIFQPNPLLMFYIYGLEIHFLHTISILISKFTTIYGLPLEGNLSAKQTDEVKNGENDSILICSE